MGRLAFEGFVEHGLIRLKDQILLPEKTKVYVIVPESEGRPIHVPSPRLVHPDQAPHFELEMAEEDPNAGI